MQDFIYKHKKTLIIGGVLIFVAIVAASIFGIIWNKIYSATISIMVTPTIAKVVIDGKEYDTIGEYKMKPGEYSVEVSADGFITKTEEFVAVENETTKVQLYLTPTEENSDWYAEHPEDALIFGELKSNEAYEKLQELKEEYPILNQLPIEIDYFTSGYANRIKYTISYELNDDNTNFIIVITDYSGGNYENALSKLEARGVKVEDFEIKYIDDSTNSEWGSAR